MNYLKTSFCIKYKCYNIDFSAGIYENKTRKSKESDIFYYWYFLDKRFNFERHVCNECQDLSTMFMNLSSIAISNIKEADYPCIISGIKKWKTIKLMQSINLKEKTRTLLNIKLYYHI